MKIKCIRDLSTLIRNGDVFDIIKKDDKRITTHQLDFDKYYYFYQSEKDSINKNDKIDKNFNGFIGLRKEDFDKNNTTLHFKLL